MAKKIAIVRGFGNVLSPDNYNIQELGLAKSLCKRYGLSVDLYFCGNTDDVIEVERNGDAIVRIMYLRFIKLPGGHAVMKGLILALRRHKYNLIQTHEYHLLTSIILALNKKSLGTGCLLLCQGVNQNYFSSFGKIYQGVIDFFLKPIIKNKFDAVIAKTNAALTYLKSKGFKQDINIGPIGLDVNKFNEFTKLDWRQKLNIDEDCPIIINVSTIASNKNITYILQGLASLPEELKYIYVHVGTESESGYLQECMKIAEDAGISNKVLFIGRVIQRDLPSLYKQCSIMVTSSNSGIYGMVLLEAMYFNLPVIANSFGGSIDIVDNGITGLLGKDATNPEEWATMIRGLLETPLHARELGANGYKKIEDKLQWDQACSYFYQAYKPYLLTE